MARQTANTVLRVKLDYIDRKWVLSGAAGNHVCEAFRDLARITRPFYAARAKGNTVIVLESAVPSGLEAADIRLLTGLRSSITKGR